MTEHEWNPPDLRPGDVVLVGPRRSLGVVLDAYCMVDARGYEWSVKVDVAGEGTIVVPLDQILESDDPASIAEARALGLRFPRPRRLGEFRPADVVRTHDGRLGIVAFAYTHEQCFGGQTDVHVNLAGEGVGIWPPELLTLSNDRESVAEVRRLGLDFPWPGPDPELPADAGPASPAVHE